jgi:hypothetical protein
MSHTDIVIVVLTLTFVSSVGLYGIIKNITVSTPRPTNVLRRQHQDIELQHVDPIQSNFNIRDMDLSSLPEYPTSQAVINHIPIR